jgi:hypothetical protein
LIANKIRRRRLTEQERAEVAEAKAFRPSDPSNRRTLQLLFVLALPATVAGIAFTLSDRLRVLGLSLLAVGIVVLVTTAVWFFRNWDY